MVLDDLIGDIKDTHKKLTERFDHLYYASLALLAIKGLDIASTSLYMHKFNDLNAELNPISRYAMDRFGIDTGLMIKDIPLTITVLGLGYFLNRMYKDSDSRIFKNIGSVTVYAVTLPGIPIVINNFIQYLTK